MIRRVVMVLVASLAATWLVLIVGVSLLPAPIAGVLYAIGARICHQQSVRSFHAFGAQLAVCARCTGLYAGAALGVALGLNVRVRGIAALATPRVLLMVGATPTAVSWLCEWAGLWAGSNVARAIAGIPLGAVAGVMVAQALATLHYGGCQPRPPIASNRPSTRI